MDILVTPLFLQPRDMRFLEKAVQIFNSVQDVFVASIGGQLDMPGSASEIAWPLAAELKEDGSSGQHRIYVTSKRLEDNWFSHTAGCVSLVSTADWTTHFSPPNVDCYLLFELAMCLFIQSCDIDEYALEPHMEDTGCFFDMCAHKPSMRLKMKCGYLCAAHEQLYRQFGGTDENVAAIVAVVNSVRCAALGLPQPLPKRRREGKPRVFVGSSVEGLRVAEKIQAALDHTVECTIWADGVFGLSRGSLESLVAATKGFEFAVLVLTPDDVTTKRDKTGNSPRDNVLFELGLFMGALGRDRTFMVYCRDVSMELPSDLAGIKAATFAKRSDGNLSAAIRPVAVQISEAIKEALSAAQGRT